MTRGDTAQRNADMLREYLAGATYGEIAERYGLSAPRITQIVHREAARAGFPPNEAAKISRSHRKEPRNNEWSRGALADWLASSIPDILRQPEPQRVPEAIEYDGRTYMLLRACRTFTNSAAMEVCSCCGRGFRVEIEKGGGYISEDANYCPNCGARIVE